MDKNIKFDWKKLKEEIKKAWLTSSMIVKQWIIKDNSRLSELYTRGTGREKTIIKIVEFINKVKKDNCWEVNLDSIIK